MTKGFLCTECEQRVACNCKCRHCFFDQNITNHMKEHGCTCDQADDGTRIRCAHCKWFEL